MYDNLRVIAIAPVLDEERKIGDVVRLTQVVSNLLGNACKYSPAGGRIDLVLDSDGTYDVIHYARTVQGDTQRVEFSRFKDGQMQRQVSGTLQRASE